MLDILPQCYQNLRLQSSQNIISSSGVKDNYEEFKHKKNFLDGSESADGDRNVLYQRVEFDIEVFQIEQ